LDIWIGRSPAMRNGLPLRVEAIGEHAFVGGHQVVVDLGILDGEAGNLCRVGIATGVEPGPHDVDDLDAALITGAGLE
jgi:hypothetical protein